MATHTLKIEYDRKRGELVVTHDGGTITNPQAVTLEVEYTTEGIPGTPVSVERFDYVLSNGTDDLYRGTSDLQPYKPF